MTPSYAVSSERHEFAQAVQGVVLWTSCSFAIKEAAELAGVSRSTAYGLIARGDWLCVWINEDNTCVRAVLADLRRWLGN